MIEMIEILRNICNDTIQIDQMSSTKENFSFYLMFHDVLLEKGFNFQ